MQVATLLVAKKDDYQSYFAGVMVLALACFLAVQISQQFTFISIHVSLFDIAVGVGIGGLVVYGVKYWPGVLLGIVSGYIANHEANTFVFLVSTGITIESMVAAYLIRLYLHEHFSLDYMPELLGYLLISTLVVTVFGATWICLSLLLIYQFGIGEVGFLWLNASLGKLTGAIVIAPFIIVWSQKEHYQESWPKLVELIGLMSILIIFGGVVFFGWFDTNIGGYSRYPLAYLFFPILTWAAFRFGQRISTAATIVITVFALWSLSHNLGPFSRDSIYESHFLTWLCINVASILAMILAADITQCKKIRVALKKSDERLNLATSGSQDGLWDWTNVEEDKMWWSPNFYELLGYKKDEIDSTHKQIVNLMHQDDRDKHLELLDKHLKDNVQYNIDFRLQTKSGVYRWFHAKAEAIYDAKLDSQRMAGSIVDIHERIQAQEEITQLNKTLEERVVERTAELEDINSDLHREIMHRNKAELEIVKLQNDLIRMGRIGTMGEMASTMSHELHQPLMAIINYSQSALLDLKDNKDIDSDVVDNIKRISDQALRGGQIIREMRAFAVRGQTTTERYDINQLIVELKPLFEIEVTQNDVDLILDLAHEEFIAEINHVQIQQVISNLVRNSIEAMKYNNSDKILTIRTMRLTENRVAIEVIDNGGGVEEKNIHQIFESFYTTKSEGLGLGLSISQKIIDAHDGSLKLINHNDGVLARITLQLLVPTHD